MCAYPHRIPSPPSYVPDEFFPVDVDTFFGRVGNMMVHLIAPHLAVKVGYFLFIRSRLETEGSDGRKRQDWISGDLRNLSYRKTKYANLDVWYESYE